MLFLRSKSYLLKKLLFKKKHFLNHLFKFKQTSPHSTTYYATSKNCMLCQLFLLAIGWQADGRI